MQRNPDFDQVFFKKACYRMTVKQTKDGGIISDLGWLVAAIFGDEGFRQRLDEPAVGLFSAKDWFQNEGVGTDLLGVAGANPPHHRIDEIVGEIAAEPPLHQVVGRIVLAVLGLGEQIPGPGQQVGLLEGRHDFDQTHQAGRQRTNLAVDVNHPVLGGRMASRNGHDLTLEPEVGDEGQRGGTLRPNRPHGARSMLIDDGVAL